MLTQNTATGATTAANTQAQAGVLMQQHRQYTQDAGRFTPQVSDDTFYKTP